MKKYDVIVSIILFIHIMSEYSEVLRNFAFDNCIISNIFYKITLFLYTQIQKILFLLI